MARKKTALVCAILAFLSGGGYLGYQANHEAIMAEVKSALVSGVADATDARLELDGIDLESPFSARADNVSLYTKDGEKLGAVKSVTVDFNPIALLWNMDEPVKVIREISLEAPSVYLTQSADGAWNVESLLSEDESSDMSLESRIRVTEGEAVLTMNGEVWQVTNVEGTLDLLADSVYEVDMTCMEGGASLGVKGRWGDASSAVVVEAKDVAIARYAPILPSEWKSYAPSGMITAGNIVIKGCADDIKVSGDIDLSDGAFRYDDIAISALAGRVTFSPEKVGLNIAGNVAQQAVSVSGDVLLDRPQTELSLHVRSDGFDLGAIPKVDLPISGTAKVDAKIVGAVDDIAVDATVEADGRAYGYDFRGLVAKVGFMKDILMVRELTAKAFDGQLVMQGAYDINKDMYGFEAAVHQADATLFGEYVPDLIGRASLHMTVGGYGTEPDIKGRLVMANGQYLQKDFTNLIIDFAKRDGQVQVAGASVETEQGARLALFGTIENDRLDMRAIGSEVPLSWLHNEETCAGGIDVEAVIGGTLSDPTAKMKIHANDGAILRQPFDRMEGTAEYQGGEVKINDFVLRNYQYGMDSGHTVQGTVGITGEKKLDLYVDTKKIRAEALSGWIDMDTKLTGNLDNRLHVTGTLDQPVLNGEYELRDGSFGSLLIAGSSGKYSLDDKGFHIEDMRVSSLNTEVELKGDITPSRDIDLRIRAVDVEIERLYLDMPYAIIGRATFYGKLEGSLDSPMFKGAVRSNGLDFNGTVLKDIKGNVTVRNKVLTIPEFSFSEGDGQYRFDGVMRFDETKKMDGKFVTEGGHLGPLLAVFNLPDAGVDGALTGDITIGGTMNDPNIHVQGVMTDGLIKGEHPLTDVAIDASLIGNVITVNKFYGKQNQGILAVEGTADLKGELDMEMAGSHIDAEILTDWFDLGIDTEGEMDFAVQLAGTIEQPYANASVEIDDVGIADTRFDRLVGMFVVDDRMLRIDQLLLSKDEYRASAYGIIPFGAVIKREDLIVEEDDEIDVTLQLDNADLRVLELLSDEVEEGIGPMTGEVRIGGAVDDPRFYGNVNIENGTIKLKQVKTPLENTFLDIAFDGKTITLRELSGMMGGGTVSAYGEATMVGNTWDDFHASMMFDRFTIDSLYYKGPISGSLIFANGERMPKLTGDIEIKNATIDIPPIPETEESDWDMALDVTVEAKDKVRLYNSYLYDLWIDGRAHFGRTVKYPKTDGIFKVKRGTVSYLNTDFKVQEGWAKFDQVTSFVPSVHLKAETKIDRVKVMLGIDDPADEMTLNLTASPAMSHENILSLLTLRSRYFDKEDSGGFGNDELVGMLELGLQMSFMGAVESVIRETFDVDEFKLVRDTVSLAGFASSRRSDREEVYNVQIGKYLTDRLMLRYTMGVGYDGYNFGVYYDMNDRFRLITTFDEDQNSFYGVETYFKF